MFKFLRSKAKVFYWVIAVTFVAFIFLAWGMDITGRQGGGAGGGRASDTVGSVNGKSISAYYWDRTEKRYLSQLRAQYKDRQLTANQVATTSERAWNDLVRAQLLEAEVERLGLTVTSEEILSIFKNNPPRELLAQYADENGNPDMGRYYNDLNNPARDWSREEQWLRALLPSQKMQQIITAPAVVTDEEIREAYQRQFGRACAEYIGVRFSDLEDEWEPSEEQILAYYESRPNEFKSQAQGRAKVVSWSRVPSDADREEVLELAMEIKAGIESGENDFAAEAAIYSQDGTANNGGDLGTFDRNRMVEPFTEVAFSLPVGQISEPVATQFGLHLIEVLEQIEEEGEITQVHARHILLKVEPSEATLGDIYTRADEFRESVNRDDFVARATADSLALIDPEPFLKGRDIPGLPLSIAGCNFVFRAEAGTVSRVLGNKDVYYVVLCEGVDEAGQAPLDEVRSQVVVSLKNEHNRELASAKLAPALAEVQQGQAMAEIAEKHGLAHAVTDTINANANVPDVGYATAFNTLALHASLETLIPQVETMRGVFAMRVLWQEPFDDTLFNTSKESLRQSLLIQKQNELLEAWFNDRLAKADVKDERP